MVAVALVPERADIELTDGEYQALREAAAGFRPITGPPALPRLLWARLS